MTVEEYLKKQTEVLADHNESFIKVFSYLEQIGNLLNGLGTILQDINARITALEDKDGTQIYH